MWQVNDILDVSKIEERELTPSYHSREEPCGPGFAHVRVCSGPSFCHAQAGKLELESRPFAVLEVLTRRRHTYIMPRHVPHAYLMLACLQVFNAAMGIVKPQGNAKGLEMKLSASEPMRRPHPLMSPDGALLNVFCPCAGGRPGLHADLRTWRPAAHPAGALRMRVAPLSTFAFTFTRCPSPVMAALVRCPRLHMYPTGVA